MRDKSDIDMAIVLDHQFFAKCGADFVKPILWNSHVECIDIAAEIPVTLCLRIVVTLVERVPDSISLFRILRGVILMAKHFRGLGRDVSTQPVEECVDKFVLWKSECRSPVTEVVPVERSALRCRLVE